MCVNPRINIPRPDSGVSREKDSWGYRLMKTPQLQHMLLRSQNRCTSRDEILQSDRRKREIVPNAVSKDSALRVEKNKSKKSKPE